MKQSVRYNSRLGLFQFYRGGYDPATEHGVDPYDYDVDPVSTAKGNERQWMSYTLFW